MHIESLHIRRQLIEPHRGALLVAEPFLDEGCFRRAVICLAEYSEKGAVGFVLNSPTQYHLDELLEGVGHIPSIPVYCGGPVGTDHLFFLHDIASLPGAVEVASGLFANGDFDMLLDYQTPYQKVVERMFQLYREHGNHWHMEKFQKIISDEKLLPDGEDLQEVETKPHRKFTPAPKITGRLQNANKRDYDRAMQEIGSNSAKLWTPTMQRPGSMQWIDPAEMQKRVEELKKRR